MEGFKLSPGQKLSILLLLIATLGVYFCSRITTDSAGPETPCSDAGFPGRCYNVPEAMCQVVWDKTEATCDEFVKSLNLPPGRLMGPVVSKCRLMYYDKPFIYLHKQTEECNQIFNELEIWKRRNNFK